MNEKLEMTYINNQDDFFEFSLFESYWDCLDNRKDLPRKLKVQLIACLVFAVVTVLVPIIDNSYLWLVLGIAVMFLLNYLYQYNLGYLNDFKNLNKLRKENDSKNIINVYDEKLTFTVVGEELELLSDLQHRFFTWRDIEYIQEIDNLIVFKLYLSNRPEMKGFDKVTIAKRYIFPEKLARLREIIEEKRVQYKIPELLPGYTMEEAEK